MRRTLVLLFMPLTLYQFNLLPDHESAEYLWANGVHIDERLEDERKVILYQVDSFYVEVYYHPGTNEIQRLRSFSSVEQLEPYLEKIRVDIPLN